jgi:hypothetical protein
MLHLGARQSRARVGTLVALLVLAGIGVVLAAVRHFTSGGVRFSEVHYERPLERLGRDLVIRPGDAVADRIEELVLVVAAANSRELLRVNVFTSEAAARRRRELIATGRFAVDEMDPDPPEWAEVYPAWVGIYTRDREKQVHQLSLCLDDPMHRQCAVRQYPPNP